MQLLLDGPLIILLEAALASLVVCRLALQIGHSG